MIKPLWSDEQIETAVKEAAHNDLPDMLTQSVTVFRARQLLRKMRYDYDKRIAELEAQLAAATRWDITLDVRATMREALLCWRTGMEFDEERMHLDAALAWLDAQEATP